MIGFPAGTIRPREHSLRTAIGPNTQQPAVGCLREVDERAAVRPRRAPLGGVEPSQYYRRPAGDRDLLQRDGTFEETDPLAVGRHERIAQRDAADERCGVKLIERA